MLVVVNIGKTFAYDNREDLSLFQRQDYSTMPNMFASYIANYQLPTPFT